MNMTQEEKNLLLKDLCARLPYGVKFQSENIETALFVDTSDDEVWINGTCIDDFKPFLFPLSSMTDKELIEFLKIRGLNLNSDELKTFRNREIAIVTTLSLYSRHIDWLNKHHFDYRGLIPMGLAIDASGLNIY